MYEMTLTISPMIKDNTINNFLKKRSFSIDALNKSSINDVLTMIAGISSKRGELFELLPSSPKHCFTFINTKDIGGICNEIKEVLNKLEDVSYSIRSPEDIMRSACISGDTNQFRDIDELIESVITGIVNM